MEILLVIIFFIFVTHIKYIDLQGCFEENPKALLTPDSQGNTIAHLVAASGNNEVFEV